MLADTKPIETSAREREAIDAGCRAGIAAMTRFRGQAVLELFVGIPHSERPEPKLDALRAYAELRYVMSPLGRAIDAGSLVSAGYTTDQIARFDTLILACR